MKTPQPLVSTACPWAAARNNFDELPDISQPPAVRRVSPRLVRFRYLVDDTAGLVHRTKQEADALFSLHKTPAGSAKLEQRASRRLVQASRTVLLAARVVKVDNARLS